MITDARYKALTQYRATLATYLSEPLSEADTRAKFIDVLLKDVLGWREEDLRRERTFWTQGERAATDYEVGRPLPVFLVEAKRLMTDFELPDSTGRHLYRLDGVIGSCPRLWDAILQARTYCDDKGIRFALITNGSRFALFRAITLGRPWREGNAAVFSLDTLLGKHFVPFHDCLSAEKSNVTQFDMLLENIPTLTKAVRIADIFAAQVGRLSNRLLVFV